MVHALEEIHRLLRPTGTLIEIHPAIEPPPFVEVRSGDDLMFSEEDPGFDYADDSVHAEAAIATVAERRLFAVDAPRSFDLRTHAGSVEEIRHYWDVYNAFSTELKGDELVRRKDEMYERASAVMDRSPDSELVFVEPALMTRLRPV